MNWDAGFTASYHAYTVDPVTWRDQELFEIDSGTINRTEAGLRESADIKSIDYDKGSDIYIRIYLDAYQDGDSDQTALFTGLVSAPEEEVDGAYTETSIQCYSVLKPAQDVLLERGWYAAKGFVGSEQIKRLLSVCPAPIDTQGESPRLSQHIIAEQGETHLSMVEKILDAINWALAIKGDGTITLSPKPEEPAAVFDSLRSDVITSKIKRTHDWFACPNVLRAISDGSSATAKDWDDSELSIDKRGREVWKEETNVTLTDGETISAYAARRLKDLQSSSVKLQYSRIIQPDIYVSDLVRINYPAQDVSGVYVVEGQKISLDHCATVSEEVRKVRE